MSEMLERVKLALEVAGIDSYMEGDYEGLARVAIEAMREPTEAMMVAPSVVAFDFGDIWRAMVDAALVEEKVDERLQD